MTNSQITGQQPPNRKRKLPLSQIWRRMTKFFSIDVLFRVIIGFGIVSFVLLVTLQTETKIVDGSKSSGASVSVETPDWKIIRSENTLETTASFERSGKPSEIVDESMSNDASVQTPEWRMIHRGKTVVQQSSFSGDDDVNSGGGGGVDGGSVDDNFFISSTINTNSVVPRIVRIIDGEEVLFPWNSKFVKSLGNEQYKKCKVFMSGMKFENETISGEIITNSTTNMTSGESTTDFGKEETNDETEIFPHEKKFHEECVPMQQWQTTFYPTCNLMHEIDLTSRPHVSLLNSTYAHVQEEETLTTFLNARGSWRMAWKISPLSHHLANVEAGASLNHVGFENSIPDMKEKRLKNLDGRENHAAVLKMLRLDRSYDAHSFANHQLDAMAMERLTSSPYILDVYNFCGQSTMAEFATGDIRGFLKNSLLGPSDRFHIARSLVRGLSHIHGIDSHLGTNVTLAHNDINLANIVRVRHTSLKYHDFNIGVPLKWDTKENRPCGFPVRYASPLWRSPEEIRNSTYVSEKVDIYSFGNVLFQIMTKHQPWTHLEPRGDDGNLLSMEEIQERKLEGRLPHVPTKFIDSTNWRTQALYLAMRLCYDVDPFQRPSAFELSIAFERMWNAFRRAKNATVDDVSEVLNDFRIRLPRR